MYGLTFPRPFEALVLFPQHVPITKVYSFPRPATAALEVVTLLREMVVCLRLEVRAGILIAFSAFPIQSVFSMFGFKVFFRQGEFWEFFIILFFIFKITSSSGSTREFRSGCTWWRHHGLRLRLAMSHVTAASELPELLQFECELGHNFWTWT